MEVLHAIITSAGSIITLFILTKLMGNRELSQLSMFDYINGITIGSIAAEMATAMFTDVIKPFTAMIVYAVIIILISYLTDKSIKLRRLFNGEPVILYNSGELYSANLKKSKMDLGEFLTQCRISGYFDLSKVQTIVLEESGKLSFLPLSDERPATPKDLNIKPNQEMLVANVIIDGKIMEKNLQHTGKDEKWLQSQIKAHGVNDISEIFLATCDIDNKLRVYKKNEENMRIDLLN